MGRGYTSKCEICGYEFSGTYGIGFLFPQQYEELVEKAKSGELGNEIQSFFEENEDGAIDAEYVTLCCEDCGNLEIGYDLSMWLPKEKNEPVGYVMRIDLEDNYKKVMDYPHICSKCSGKMKVIHQKDHKKLKCPKCKKIMKEDKMLLWD